MPDKNGPIYSFTERGETYEIVTRPEAEELARTGTRLKVEVASGRFRLAHEESESTRGDLMRTGEKATLTPMGEPIHAYVDATPAAGSAELLVREREFDLSFEPVNAVFSAGETEGTDAPAASDGHDAVTVKTQHSSEEFAGLSRDGRTATTDENYVELSVPRAAETLTLMVELKGGWVDSDEVTMFVEWAQPSLRNDQTAVTYRDDSDNPDYGCTGSDGSAYVSGDVPVGESGTARVGVVVQQLDGTVIDATSVFHAVIR